MGPDLRYGTRDTESHPLRGKCLTVSFQEQTTKLNGRIPRKSRRRGVLPRELRTGKSTKDSDRTEGVPPSTTEDLRLGRRKPNPSPDRPGKNRSRFVPNPLPKTTLSPDASQFHWSNGRHPHSPKKDVPGVVKSSGPHPPSVCSIVTGSLYGTGLLGGDVLKILEVGRSPYLYQIIKCLDLSDLTIRDIFRGVSKNVDDGEGNDCKVQKGVRVRQLMSIFYSGIYF